MKCNLILFNSLIVSLDPRLPKKNIETILISLVTSNFNNIPKSFKFIFQNLSFIHGQSKKMCIQQSVTMKILKPLQLCPTVIVCRLIFFSPPREIADIPP